MVAYQYGARSAAAQGSNEIAVGSVYGGGAGYELAATSDGRIYVRSSPIASNSWSLFRSIPVTAPVVGIDADAIPAGIKFFVFCRDGTVLEFENSSGPITSTNVFAGGPTPAAQPTFGQLKAQYRK
jgi:hypothetical protein